MNLKAKWQGDPPKVGEYVMSTQRPKYAYRVLGIRDQRDTVLDLVVERVSPFEVPDDAVVHSWKWDDRSPKRKELRL